MIEVDQSIEMAVVPFFDGLDIDERHSSLALLDESFGVVFDVEQIVGVEDLQFRIVVDPSFQANNKLLDGLPSLHNHLLVLEKPDFLELDHRLHYKGGDLQGLVVLERPDKFVYDLDIQELLADVFLDVGFAKGQQHCRLNTGSVCVAFGVGLVETALPETFLHLHFHWVSVGNRQEDLAALHHVQTTRHFSPLKNHSFGLEFEFLGQIGDLVLLMQV